MSTVSALITLRRLQVSPYRLFVPGLSGFHIRIFQEAKEILNGYHDATLFPGIIYIEPPVPAVLTDEVSSHPPSAVLCLSCSRLYSQKPSRGDIVAREQGQGEVSTHVLETVKETTKTASYSLVILAGVGITFGLFYVIFSELFSSKSPNSVYSRAVEKCCDDVRVKDALGEPIRGHGEETSRRRRRFVSHIKYIKDGAEHMRMKFYLKGLRKSATVHLEVREDEKSNYQYRYMFLQLEDYPYRVIVLEDNRQDTSVALSAPRLEPEAPLAPIWQ